MKVKTAFILKKFTTLNSNNFKNGGDNNRDNTNGGVL